MLTIEKTVLPSPEQWDIIIEGMRNPKNSWEKSDSYEGCNFDNCETCPGWAYHDCRGANSRYIIGQADHGLMMRLAKGGPVHAKYRRMIPVFLTINAPLYWWKEFDTYKVGTVANSCSTMHKIHSKEFTPDDFSHDYLNDVDILFEEPHPIGELAFGVVPEDMVFTVCHDCQGIFDDIIKALNALRQKYLDTNDKKYWYQMIQLLPTSYNQKRSILLNYEVLVGIYNHRRNHKLDEWHTFCNWIETLPYSELITGGEEDVLGS